MSKLETYLEQLTACHQAAAAAILQLYQKQGVEAASTTDGVRLIWRGAHVLHQEFGSTEQPPQPLEERIDPATWRQICRQAYRQNSKGR